MEGPRGESQDSVSENENGSSATDIYATTRSATEREEQGLGQIESLAVNRSKVLVYLALFITAVVTGVTTYLLLSRTEKESFESEFDQGARQIFASAEQSAKTKLRAIGIVSTAITSQARSSFTRWPNYTLPDFPVFAKRAIDISEAEVVAWGPIVPHSMASEWVSYATENQGWIKEDLRRKGMDSIDIGPFPSSIVPVVTDALSSHNYSFHIPLWQSTYLAAQRGFCLSQARIIDALYRNLENDPCLQSLTIIFLVFRVRFQKHTFRNIQVSPPPRFASVVGRDLMALQWFRNMALDIIQGKHVALGGAVLLDFLINSTLTTVSADPSHPRCMIAKEINSMFYRVDDGGDGTQQRVVTGMVGAVIPWESFLDTAIPEGKGGYIVEVNDHCGEIFTYKINGPVAIFQGYGSLHESKFNGMMRTSALLDISLFNRDSSVKSMNTCHYTIDIYPSSSLESYYKTKEPLTFALILAAVFVVTISVFLIYDYTVQKRQKKVMAVARQTSNIIHSLFPKIVRDKIMAEAKESNKRESIVKRNRFSMRDDLIQDVPANDQSDIHKTSPIAEFFPEATIMFADIVGFTAWSSIREPWQVFTLLERIYFEFDQIATAKRIFKVETVGDCYVAAAGLPEARKDHAVAMARFARDCINTFVPLMIDLELELGPGTADLGLRAGVHSGPITAGVLRGQKARFQLFGDTMNTTSRIETTGAKNKVHVSEDTAKLLFDAGKEQWLIKREEKVQAKGKGTLQTYWLQTFDNPEAALQAETEKDENSSRNRSGSAPRPSMKHVPETVVNRLSDKQLRLVQWNTDILRNLLKESMQQRVGRRNAPDSLAKIRLAEKSILGGNVLEEVMDAIDLISLNSVENKSEGAEDVDDVKVSEDVEKQLNDYMQTLAALYRDNAFHSFEHASHVTMSMIKLISRMVATTSDDSDDDPFRKKMHLIMRNPLTKFAIVFSAIIHDVDHHGVPNSQLIKEKSTMAAAYKNRSIAEQNSVDIAWNLLMDSSYTDLRLTIYTTESELRYFRQIVVNAVMATDVLDKNLRAQRQDRWDKAFSERKALFDKDDDRLVNLKATLLIEHLVQASDVAHTIQHWHIYDKWNSKLFDEMNLAFTHGRGDGDPARYWYDAEIDFFDNFVLPLARNLKQSNVLGPSGDEHVNNATKNRDEWVAKGRKIIARRVDLLAEDLSEDFQM